MNSLVPLPLALALVAQPRYDSRWHGVRINRRQDDRDILLAEAIRRVEARQIDQGYSLIGRRPAGLVSPSIAAGPQTGLTIAGLNLLGLRLAKASATFGTGNGALTFEAVFPGKRGITVIVSDTGEALTVDADLEEGSVSVVHDGDTATAIAAAINDDSVARYLVNVTAGGTGGSVPADIDGELTGAEGPETSSDFFYPAMVLIGSPNGVISMDGSSEGNGVTSWTNNAIVLDFDPSNVDGSPLTAGISYPILLQLDGVSTVIGFITPRAEKTVGIDALSGVADGGTWTKAATTGGLATVTRTAADAPSSYWITLPTPPTGPSGTITPLGIDANYSVNTADLADVRFELWKETVGADGSAPTAAVLMGEDDADYDDAHNTAAERGDDTGGPEEHKIVMRNAGAAVAVGPNDVLKLRVFVDGDAGPAGVFVLKNAKLVYAD